MSVCSLESVVLSGFLLEAKILKKENKLDFPVCNLIYSLLLCQCFLQVLCHSWLNLPLIVF